VISLRELFRVNPDGKALRRLHPVPTLSTFVVPRSQRDYRKDIGDGLGSSVIMAPTQFIMRVFPEARPMIWEKEGLKQVGLPDHRLLKLLNQPNDFYSGTVLWASTVLSYAIAGNAYWLKVRDNEGAVRQLWYTPHWLLEPKWPRRSNVYISHYEYNPGDGPGLDIPPQDVVHFRYGINPRNTRLGLSPLDSVLREIFTDEEASNYTASLLRNMGVPGVTVAPGEEGWTISQDDMEDMKREFMARFTGDRRGEPIFMSGPTKIQKLAFNPQEMNLGEIRNISEERVCANLGIPAAVVGFGTGLQQTKVGATMRELVRLAWTAGIIPMQRSLSEEIERSLLPDFEPEPDRFIFEFDRSKVEALQESESEKAERIANLVRASIMRVAQAQRELGLEVDPTQEVYLRSISIAERPANDPDFVPQVQLVPIFNPPE
jgi:HK97 family phage portal protein